MRIAAAVLALVLPVAAIAQPVSPPLTAGRITGALGYTPLAPNGNGSGLTNLNASNINSGTLPPAQIPAPTGSTLGGVQSSTSTAHQWVSYIDTSGVEHLTQPAFTDISGNPSSAQVTGGLGYTPLAPSNNLSDLANTTTARTNLGLGSLAPLNTSSNISWSGVNTFSATHGIQVSGNVFGTPETPLIVGAAGTVLSYNNGFVADAVVTPITLTAGATTFSGQTGTPVAGQTLVVDGVGTGGGPFQTTFASSSALTAGPTYSTGGYYATQSCPVSAPGGAVGSSYAIGDTLTASGGTLASPSAPTKCTVDYTTVNAVTLASGGTSTGSSGPCTLLGTTGTGSRFEVSGTVSGGAFQASGISVIIPGVYSVSPTSLTAEPAGSVTAGCTFSVNPTFQLGMGVFHATKAQNGVYTASPISGSGTGTGVVSTTTSGSGTGAQLNLTYAKSGATVTQTNGNVIGPVYGTDNTSALSTAMAATKSVTMNLSPGAYLFATCGQVQATHSLNFVGAGPDLTQWIVADECSPGGSSPWAWLNWIGNSTTSFARLAHMTIDLRYMKYSSLTSGQFSTDINLNAVRAIVQDVHILNGAPQTIMLSNGSSSTTPISGSRFEHNYFTQVPDVVNGSVLTLSQNTGLYSNAIVVGNIAIGGPMALGGSGTVAYNDISGWAIGTALGFPVNGSVAAQWLSLGNKLHDSFAAYPWTDVNGAPPSGVETDIGGTGTGSLRSVGDEAWNNCGSGFVTFGVATYQATSAHGNGTCYGQVPGWNYKMQAGYRSGSGNGDTTTVKLIGANATDDGAGTQKYAISEDVAVGGAVSTTTTVSDGQLSGVTGPLNLQNSTSSGTFLNGSTLTTFNSLTISAAVTCAANSVSLTTFAIVNGIPKHC